MLMIVNANSNVDARPPIVKLALISNRSRDEALKGWEARSKLMTSKS